MPLTLYAYQSHSIFTRVNSLQAKISFDFAMIESRCAAWVCVVNACCCLFSPSFLTKINIDASLASVIEKRWIEWSQKGEKRALWCFSVAVCFYCVILSRFSSELDSITRLSFPLFPSFYIKECNLYAKNHVRIIFYETRGSEQVQGLIPSFPHCFSLKGAKAKTN